MYRAKARSGQNLALVVIPNGDQSIGTGLEKIFTGKTSVKDVFGNVTKQLERDAKDVKQQVRNNENKW